MIHPRTSQVGTFLCELQEPKNPASPRLGYIYILHFSHITSLLMFSLSSETKNSVSNLNIKAN